MCVYVCACDGGMWRKGSHELVHRHYAEALRAVSSSDKRGIEIRGMNGVDTEIRDVYVYVCVCVLFDEAGE